jgi:hypothetical protein
MPAGSRADVVAWWGGLLGGPFSGVCELLGLESRLGGHCTWPERR